MKHDISAIPEWVWDSYDNRPSWAYEATIHEWASRVHNESGYRQYMAGREPSEAAFELQYGRHRPGNY